MVEGKRSMHLYQPATEMRKSWVREMSSTWLSPSHEKENVAISEMQACGQLCNNLGCDCNASFSNLVWCW